MAGNRVTYMLDALEPGKNLKVAEFVRQMSAFRRMLASTSSKQVEWELVDVNRSNPVEFVAQSVLKSEDAPDNREHEINTCFGYWRDLQEHRRVPEGMGRGQLIAYKNLAKSGTVRSTLVNGEQRIRIDTSVVPVIDLALAPKKYAWGSVDGRLEMVNVHGDIKEVRIYPSVGPDSITCTFTVENHDLLLDATRRYIEREVRVFGRLTYPARGRYPSQVQVEDVKPLREGLADPYEIRGIAPGITGDQSPEDYVRGLRGGN